MESKNSPFSYFSTQFDLFGLELYQVFYCPKVQQQFGCMRNLSESEERNTEQSRGNACT